MKLVASAVVPSGKFGLTINWSEDTAVRATRMSSWIFLLVVSISSFSIVTVNIKLLFSYFYLLTSLSHLYS